MKNNSRNYHLLVFIVIVSGFCLRVYQLGDDSFWNDEAGQALAATQPTVSEMIGMIKTHAMAMPLDYFVTRMFSTLGTTEFILRFPAVLWGTLTLVLYFIFIKKCCEEKTAVFTIWVLAISPLLIYYSQELRFYAALIFFYALSNLCLFSAVSRPSKSAWIVYSIVTAIGSYFHPYVLLSALNGFLYLAFFRGIPSLNYKNSIALIVSILLSGILFLPGYFYLGAQQKFNYQLMQWGGPLHFVIFDGLGWRAMYYCKTVFGMWEILNIVFAAAGLLSVILRYRQNTFLLSMVIGAFVQIGIIILMDWVKGYWFLGRQLVYLIPTLVILTAVGCVRLSDYMSKLFNVPAVKHWSALIIITLFTLSAVPRLADYYRFPKSTGREIVAKLVEVHRAGEPVFVIPGHEDVIYRFYLSQANNGENMVKDLRPSSWEYLSAEIKSLSTTLYLIAPVEQFLFDIKKQEILNSSAFYSFFIPDKKGAGMQVLFKREKGSR